MAGSMSAFVGGAGVAPAAPSRTALRCTSFSGATVAAPAVVPSSSRVTASLGDYLVRRSQEDVAKVAAALPSVATVAAVAAAVALVAAPSAQALTRQDIASLTYEQVKGTGLANRCPEVDAAKGAIKLSPGTSYKLVDLCLEPKSFQVEEEVSSKRSGEVKKSFVDTKLMTRATYTLTGIEGKLYSDGTSVTFEETGGIDYAATTVQLPGGERVPFLFTVKALKAVAGGGDITTATEFGGDFKVPSYRSGLFLDPKGRGGTTGYDMAVGLPAMQADGNEGQDELAKETNKIFQVTDGEIEMAVNKIDPASGEIAGVFVSEQLSDTDMGAKAPKKILLKGVFYARVEEQ